MSKEIGKYNSDLQLFEEPFKGYDYSKLRFLRWMGNNGLLEHGVAGPPEGDLVLPMTAQYGRGNPQSRTEVRRSEFLRRGGYGPISQYDQQIK